MYPRRQRGAGQGFTALSVIKYYELRNRTVPSALPEKAGRQLAHLQGELHLNNPIASRRPSAVRCALPYGPVRDHGLSGSTHDLAKLNWGNYDLVVIDESHNFHGSAAIILVVETTNARTVTSNC